MENLDTDIMVINIQQKPLDNLVARKLTLLLDLCMYSMYASTDWYAGLLS